MLGSWSQDSGQTLIGRVTGQKLEVDMQLGYSFTPLIVPELGRISRENERTGEHVQTDSGHSILCTVYSISRG